MASRDEIDRYERSLNYIGMIISQAPADILDGWDDAAGMTRRQKLTQDLQLIAACDDPRIRARARDYLARL